MSKSKNRFTNPKRWKPLATGYAAMQQDADGNFILIDDYQKLLFAYGGALCQLDSAAILVKSLKQTIDERVTNGT